MPFLPSLAQVYVNSATVTSVTAAIDTYYVVDTATAAVTLTLPQAVPVGHWVVVQNAPNNGPQVGGTVAGFNVNVQSSGSETLEGAGSDSLVPPTTLVTAACHKYFPVGGYSATSGFGAGWVIF